MKRPQRSNLPTASAGLPQAPTAVLDSAPPATRPKPDHGSRKAVQTSGATPVKATTQSSGQEVIGSRVYQSRSAAQRREERRAKLIRAGIDLYGTTGYHGTSVKRICQRAGLTERYFYESFGNSEALIEAAFRECSSVFMSTAVSIANSAPGTPVDRIGAVVTSYLEQLKQDPARARLVLIEAEGVSTHLDEIYRQGLGQIADLIRLVICRDLPSAPANGLSAELLCIAYLGALYQLLKTWGLEGFKTPTETMVHNAKAVFRGIVNEWQGGQSG